MNDHHIKNVVFDIGNVFVRWSPIEICRLTFGDNGDIATHAETIFTHDLWLALNKGLFSEAEVKTQYHQLLGYSPDLLDQLFYYIKETQIQIYGSFELFKAIKNAGYKTFALTDNVFEIVEYLKQRYTFWPLFDGHVVSANVQQVKPSQDIFRALLDTYQIAPHETVFIDDLRVNIEGAGRAGIHGIQFFNANQCANELRALGLEF